MVSRVALRDRVHFLPISSLEIVGHRKLRLDERRSVTLPFSAFLLVVTGDPVPK